MANYFIKGIVITKDEVTTTKLGTDVQRLHFEQEGSGRVFYPVALGSKIKLLEDIIVDDVVEIEFHISGSKGTYNNVIIDNITRL